MCWNKEDRNIKPTLEWLRIELRGKYAGEILAGFEIFLDDDGSVVPQTPIMKEKWYTLPPNIQPELRQYRVKVHDGNISNAANYQCLVAVFHYDLVAT